METVVLLPRKSPDSVIISLADIARYKSGDPTAVIQNGMRNRDVIEFLGLWKRLHNPDFKPIEFEGFKKQAGAFDSTGINSCTDSLCIRQ